MPVSMMANMLVGHIDSLSVDIAALSAIEASWVKVVRDARGYVVNS